MRKDRPTYLAEEVKDLDDPAFDTFMEKVTGGERKSRPEDSYVHIEELEEAVDKVRKERGQFKGFSTGYKVLDDKMGGLEKGSVVLIGGKTSNGKSALATNIAAKVCDKDGPDVPLLYISLEMTQEQMLDRLDNITDPKRLNMMFQKSYGISYKDLEPLILKAKMEREIEVVVLDYLQYLGRGMNLDEVARMSKTIKALALKYDICMMVIVSLRKGNTTKNEKWTDISTDDLMGTSAISYDADTIVLASRKSPEDQFVDNRIYVKILKTRNTYLNFNENLVELEWERTKIKELDAKMWLLNQ